MKKKVDANHFKLRALKPKKFYVKLEDESDPKYCYLYLYRYFPKTGEGVCLGKVVDFGDCWMTVEDSLGVPHEFTFTKKIFPHLWHDDDCII